MKKPEPFPFAVLFVTLPLFCRVRVHQRVVREVCLAR